MSDLSPTDVAPTWVWLATVICGALTVTVAAVDAVAYSFSLVEILAGATGVGVLYLLYRWGQLRERNSPNKGDREREMEAEAGGYGGSGGGG